MSTTQEQLADLTQSVNELTAETIDLKIRAEEAVVGTEASEQAAKTSEQNAETHAKKAELNNQQSGSNANRSEAAAIRADEIAGLETVRDALRLAAVPEPDFHLPLVSDLQIRNGFGPQDQIDISAAQDGSQMIDLPTRSLSFRRASTKWYENKSGVLTKAEVDEPAFEKEGILIEGPSTNLLVNSNNFTTWVVYPNSTEMVVTPSAIAGPDGAPNSATKVDFVGNTGWLLTQGLTTDIDKSHTASIWMKGAVGGERVTLDFKDQASIGQQGVKFTLTKEWQRYDCTSTIQQDANNSVKGFQIRKNDGVPGSIYIYGAQMEAIPFCSSYIPTDLTPVTRASDFLHFQRIDNLVLSSRTPMSWCIDFNRFGDVPDETGYLFYSNGYNPDADVTGWAFLSWPSSGQYADMRVRQGIDLSAPSVNDSSTHRFIIAGGEQILKVYIDGAFAASGVQNNLTRIYSSTNIALGSNGVSSLYGHIRNFKIWHVELSSEQIAALG